MGRRVGRRVGGGWEGGWGGRHPSGLRGGCGEGVVRVWEGWGGLLEDEEEDGGEEGVPPVESAVAQSL